MFTAAFGLLSQNVATVRFPLTKMSVEDLPKLRRLTVI